MRFKLFDVSRFFKAAGSVALLAMAVAIATPAHAAPATGPGVTAVNRKFDQIDDTLRSQYYLNKSNPVPQWTPSGGVFQYFTGQWGEGAIYWWPGAQFGASVIYGDILQYFRSKNFENFFGYPLHDELPNWSASQCGASATRIQFFSNNFVICWRPGSIWHKKI